MELARMTSKGQPTIPVSIRKKFGIGTGDQLLFMNMMDTLFLRL
ncbi:MAG: AbrB/MazE/SpoVT family DNA-binding domain-containing protein [Oscillospiraceae bacterium]